MKNSLKVYNFRKIHSSVKHTTTSRRFVSISFFVSSTPVPPGNFVLPPLNFRYRYIIRTYVIIFSIIRLSLRYRDENKKRRETRCGYLSLIAVKKFAYAAIAAYLSLYRWRIIISIVKFPIAGYSSRVNNDDHVEY